MILVAVGSSQIPFDRLLQAVDGLTPGERLVVQHGPSPIRPAGARCVPFVPMDELAQLMRDARIVVTHAGVGSILLALSNGKRPIVVPRRRAFGETVDDHQVDCARRFARGGLVTLVDDPAGLAIALAAAGVDEVAVSTSESGLVTELRSYVEQAIG